MARYIDADEALRMMQHSKEDKPSYADWDTAHDCCVDCVNNVPAADVVEVVRCKDCKRCFINPFGKESNIGVCNKRGIIGATVQLDDFCSYGERR